MGSGPGEGHRADDTHSRRLLAHPSSVSAARRLVREVLTAARREDLVEAAQLLVSEVVTNALVHAGPPIDFHVSVGDIGLRVEVSDGSTQAPTPRGYGPLAGTGRGVRMLQLLVDRWGTLLRPDGKTVWFELDSGNRLDEIASSSAPAAREADLPTRTVEVVEVALLNMPLLLHVAWQEHAEELLREHLLNSLDDDNPTQALETHAAASDAMSLLHQHIPEPQLSEDPEELMTLAVEPGVSSRQEMLSVPRTSVPNFSVLDQTLDAALALAVSGAFLTPPIQPELRELRRWLCGEVARQANQEPPTPWASNPDAVLPLPHAPMSVETDLAPVGSEALIAADDMDRIVAVSRGTCELLGYQQPEDLVGRRLVAIIPVRYRQAHLAGFTLHLSNGRRPLLGRTVTVPVLRGDGSEMTVELLVESRQQPAGRHLFVARLRSTHRH